MPRHQKAKKGVAICDKPRGADKQALIRGFPNGETQHCKTMFSCLTNVRHKDMNF